MDASNPIARQNIVNAFEAARLADKSVIAEIVEIKSLGKICNRT